MTDTERALWERNNHVTSEPKPKRVEVQPFFWGEDDPKSDWSTWTGRA